MQGWSLSSEGRGDAGVSVGAVLLVAGGLILLGSLFLPWERVDLQELFGADIPSFTLKGFETGVGKIAGIFSLAAAIAGVVLLTTRRRVAGLPVAVGGLGCAIAAGIVAVVELFAYPAFGLVIGLGGAILSIVGGGLATAASPRRGGTSAIGPDAGPPGTGGGTP